MKSIAAAKFKEKCLAILDHLTPEGVIITKHGKPVARLSPIGSEPAELLGVLKGKLKVKCDEQLLFSTGIKWNAQS